MITLNLCPNCGSDNISKFASGITLASGIFEVMPGVPADSAIFSDYDSCKICGLVFQNPRMSDLEIAKFYSQGYYQRIINMNEEEKEVDEKKRAENDSEIIKKNLGKVESHLDIGCGRGYLLSAIGAKIRVGVESEESRVKRGKLIVYKDLDDIKEGKFDLVTAIHVLEHVSSPAGYLNNITKFLKNESTLVIEVPSEGSPGGPLRLAHLYFFDRQVLERICDSVGLVVVREYLTPHLVVFCKLKEGVK